MMLPHGREGLRVRRMTVLWTCRRPFMGRPVPRQLLRNELLDVTPLVPATAYHRRSYAERYSRYSVSLYEVERAVFSGRLPDDRRRSILSQRGVHTSAHPR